MLGDDTMEGAPDSLRLQAGESYPVRELLRRMVVYSDNFSYQLLLESGGSEGIPKMLYDLSAEQSVRDGRFYFDAHTVPVLLRSLYNSSFLSRRHSEMALRLLTESRFRDGIRKDLPPDALVAAKYGFHTSVMDGKPHYELHDCGIVYRPGSPYALCVMTATDRQRPEDLQDIVGEVSRLMWCSSRRQAPSSPSAAGATSTRLTQSEKRLRPGPEAKPKAGLRVCCAVTSSMFP